MNYRTAKILEQIPVKPKLQTFLIKYSKFADAPCQPLLLGIGIGIIGMDSFLDLGHSEFLFFPQLNNLRPRKSSGQSNCLKLIFPT